MYQGKFDKKSKQVIPSHSTVARRSTPVQMPALKNAPAPVKRSRGPRLSGVIFYTVFFLCIFLFYAATYLGLLELREWLLRYENAQPTTKSRQVFERLFSDPDWSALYDTAGIQDTAYESKDAFVTYMKNTVGDSELTYMETSTGLSNDQKYIVRLGDERIAAFTLVDNNRSTSQTDIPDWQLGTVEFFLARQESYYIEKLDGHTVYVNNVPLDDSFTVRIRTTSAEAYLPTGITGNQICIQEISGLVATPSIRILDENGNEMSVSYNESTRTFSEQIQPDIISEAEKETAINAVKTYALYMITKAGNADVAKYFKRGSDAYNAITDTELGYVQDEASREFVNETVSDYCRYSDSLFSVRVSLTLNLYRSNGSVKESSIEQSLFFEKQDSGKWLCYAMTAVDVSAPVEKVRLTFMSEDKVLESSFHDTDISQLTCPIVLAPEGKGFSGWMVEKEAENGSTIMELVFQPDASGTAMFSSGMLLEPMVLYPLFDEI